jgi:hypothetical protein
MHAKHADEDGLRLCQLPNVGNTTRTIKRVAPGMSAAPDHLRVLRASAYICAESFLVAAVSQVSRCGPRPSAMVASRSTIGLGV